jgi:hypothetical protein
MFFATPSEACFMNSAIKIALLSLAGICASAIAQSQRPHSLDETKFVNHDTHCLHFIGSKSSGDGLYMEYAASLEKALTPVKDDVNVRFSRILSAC